MGLPVRCSRLIRLCHRRCKNDPLAPGWKLTHPLAESTSCREESRHGGARQIAEGLDNCVVLLSFGTRSSRSTNASILACGARLPRMSPTTPLLRGGILPGRFVFQQPVRVATLGHLRHRPSRPPRGDGAVGPHHACVDPPALMGAMQ